VTVWWGGWVNLCVLVLVGGKGLLVKKLLPLVPPHKIYVEVFWGWECEEETASIRGFVDEL
jgi:hypothetical protein